MLKLDERLFFDGFSSRQDFINITNSLFFIKKRKTNLRRSSFSNQIHPTLSESTWDLPSVLISYVIPLR